MSHEATSWAWKAEIRKTVYQGTVVQRSVKRLVLLSLADRADETGRAFPSYHRLVSDTTLNRKTVVRAIASLEEDGLIADTGNRKGATHQIIVWQLVGVDLRDVDGKTTNTGCITREQRNGSKVGTDPKTVLYKETVPKMVLYEETVPSLPANSPNLTNKESQEWDTESVNESVIELDTDTDTYAHANLAVKEPHVSLPDYLIDHDCNPIIFKFIGSAYSQQNKSASKAKLWQQIYDFGLTSNYVDTSIKHYWIDNGSALIEQLEGLAQSEQELGDVRRMIADWEQDSSDAISHADRLLKEWKMQQVAA